MTLKSSTLFVGLFAVLLAGFVLGGRARAAEDKKNYPGSFCHTTGDAYDFEDVEYSVSYGDATNDEASQFNVLCPAVSDCSAIYSTGHWVLVESTSTTIYCYLCRRDQYSGSGGCGSSDYSVDKDNTPELLNPEASWTSSSTYAASWFYCTLPSSGEPRVIAYGVDENC